MAVRSVIPKKFVVKETGDAHVLQYLKNQPIPQPKEGEVLVKNVYSGVNYVDTYFRSGFYESEKPEILGREGVGEIIAIGAGTETSVINAGDRVAWLGSSGYAEYTVASIDKTIRIPDSIPFRDVAASFLGGLTVITMLDEAFNTRPGDWALLHAAAGSVGVLLVQVLKFRGARVIATAGGSAKGALVRSLGADHVIDYRDPAKSWVDTARTLTNGRGVDVVFDGVGKDTWEGSLEIVRRKGTIVWFGNASGPIPPLSLHSLASKCIKIVRPTLGGYVETREEFVTYCNELFELLESKELKVQIHKMYPLSDVQQAHLDVESRETTGKLLLRP